MLDWTIREEGYEEAKAATLGKPLRRKGFKLCGMWIHSTGRASPPVRSPSA